MGFDGSGQRGSCWQAITSFAAKTGCSANMLNDCGRKAEADSGERADIPNDMAGRMKAPERGIRELRRAARPFERPP
ncbi:MAG: hypothetical protein ACE37J_14110 [Pikeienuella sp.]|uniref:hypothetical protein n=1 Tax=Pikeienuella sp. TaxID=2831957 RepID=UPI00391B76EF